MKLNEKIYYCRKKTGMSQEILAERIGVSRQAISKWENGESEPDVKKLRTLANVFNVTLDWLLSDSNSDTEQESNTKSSVPNTLCLESIPGVIGRLLRKYGCYQVYIWFYLELVLLELVLLHATYRNIWLIILLVICQQV